VNQAIFSGSRETASTLITLRESRELIRKQKLWTQRYLFKVNQAIFSGSCETASTLITLRESRELFRKARIYGHNVSLIKLFLAGAVKPQVL
jgi:hypothetical protein